MTGLGPPYARPEMRGRYLIRNRVKAFAMAGADLVLSLLPVRRPAMPAQPRRILVCNWAHLGDVVLTLPAVQRLREAFPEAQIDFLTQGASRSVVDPMPGIGRIHVLDHWALSRAAGSASEKRARYLKDRPAVVADLAAAGYDMAIDFYQHYPNAAFELWRAGVPVRIGYASGGLSPFFTHRVDWTTDDRHVIARHGDLVALATGQPAAPLAASYPAPSEAVVAALRQRGVPDRYVLLHTGAGAVHKEWPEDRWSEVIAALTAAGERIVLAGAGKRESERNARLAAGRVLDLSGALDWTHFTALVAGATALIGLDSVAVHIGAAFGVPTVGVRSGVVSARVWGPLSDRTIQLTTPTPCAPCHRPGCDTMACLLGVAPAEVLDALARVTAQQGDVRVTGAA